MCESFSDLGLLIQQHYLGDLVETVMGFPSCVFSCEVVKWNVQSVHSRFEPSLLFSSCSHPYTHI